MKHRRPTIQPSHRIIPTHYTRITTIHSSHRIVTAQHTIETWLEWRSNKATLPCMPMPGGHQTEPIIIKVTGFSLWKDERKWAQEIRTSRSTCHRKPLHLPRTFSQNFGTPLASPGTLLLKLHLQHRQSPKRSIPEAASSFNPLKGRILECF